MNTMKQLNKVENVIFLLGAVMMVTGAVANVFQASWASYVFAMGVAAYVLMQFKQSYEGTSTTIMRLRQMVIVSDVFFIVTAVLMFANRDNLFGFDALTYAQYIHNNWVVTLLVGSVLQLYTYYRLGIELPKEQKKS